MTPTPHGQVPEALIDLIDAYAETRHRCGGIYNARTEAARNAVIEALSGVQALSAAPAGFVPVAAFDRLHAHAESLAARLLAASPTPPAEQQARWVERWHGSGGKEFWEGWSILNAANREMIAHLGPDVDPDAVRGIVAAHNEALCGECAGTGGRWCPACAGATPPAEQQAAPKAAPAWADQAVIEYRYTGGTHWCPLGPAERMKPDFDGVYRLQGGVFPAEQAAPEAAPGEPGWWRKRADEIEVQVALTGSPEAMRCFVDMRTLLQAATDAAPGDAIDEAMTQNRRDKRAPIV